MLNKIAFAFSLFASSIAGLVMAMLHFQDPVEYAIYCVLIAIISFALSLIVLHSPEAYLLFLEWQDRAAYLQLSKAKRLKEIKDLNAPTILPHVPGAKVYDRSAKWKDWFISALEYAGSIGTIQYDKAMDQVMTYQLWRKVFCHVLVGSTPPLIEPVTNGNRTALRDGLTPHAVIVMLKSGGLALPYPTEYDPPPNIAPKANAEMPLKGQQTHETLYAKDV